MNSPLKKALAVVKQGTAKALNDNSINQVHGANGNTKIYNPSLESKHKKPFNPYNAKYQSLVKRGFRYSTNQLAKYVYRDANETKYKTPNRRIKKLIMRQHNRLVLSHLSSDDKWDLPCVSYHGTRYYYVNAEQFVYLIARSHQGTAIKLREALAEVAQNIITGSISPEKVVSIIRNYRKE